MIPIIAVIGTSGTGKTTLIEYLISHLSREGLKIGTIKHVHYPDFSINAKGKDTWRHSQAGAKIVVCAAPKEIAIFKKKEVSYEKLEEIIDLVKSEKLDLLILEGFHSLIAKREDIFKIVAAKNETDMKRTLNGTVDPVLAITGPFAREKVVPLGITIPILDLDSKGEEILRLVKGIFHKK
ncbi:MAG: molybdopterin-guanine dinucleotide biosynthesis protein B [Candidatus Heimdallarchaeota archaeon]